MAGRGDSSRLHEPDRKRAFRFRQGRNARKKEEDHDELLE